MINKTDKLFINSTKAVNPTPKKDKLLGKVPIKEYIDFDSTEWSVFSYVESNKAFELYGPESAVIGVHAARVGIKNVTYVRIAPTVGAAIKMFLDLLNNLKRAAFTTRLAGYKLGEGRLIFQCRNDITLHERADGRIQLSWPGRLTRIPPEENSWVLPTNKEVIAHINRIQENPFVISAKNSGLGDGVLHIYNCSSESVKTNGDLSEASLEEMLIQINKNSR